MAKITGKLKNLTESKEVKELLESRSSKGGKKSTSKSNTPSVTTAAHSRGTHSPTKKLIRQTVKPEGKRSALEKAHSKKPSISKTVLQSTPQVPKRLKSAYKCTLCLTSAGEKVRLIMPDILDVEELLDINIRKFEIGNKSTISYYLYNLMEKNLRNPAKQESSQSTGKKPKRKVSDFNLNVGLGKRVEPQTDSARKQARNKWERINIKKDHIVKFTTKEKSYRVL